MKKLGLIVNPIAGMGGAVGLKGTDGAEVLQRAVELGATPRSLNRTIEALRPVARELAGVTILTCAGPMGESAVTACGLHPTTIYAEPSNSATQQRPATSAEDTRAAARGMLEEGVDLLLFAGGDGTARDVLTAIGTAVPVLGIPTGVKIHSGVFATTPRAAGELAVRVLRGQALQVREAEVMDIDEDAFRSGRVSARLFGYMSVPYHERSVQMPKSRSETEAGAGQSLAHAVVQLMDPDTLFIIGPGTTTRSIMDELGLDGSLLGVDVVRGGALVARDVNEQGLLNLLRGEPAKIVVTPIGGQGYIFGRGNHQLSGRVIKAVGFNNILVVATPTKLFGLRGAPLLVDSDDDEVNRALEGYTRVITGVGQVIVYPIGWPQ